MDSRSLPRATLEYTESEDNTAITTTPNKKEEQFSKRDSLKALPASAHLLKVKKERKKVSEIMKLSNVNKNKKLFCGNRERNYGGRMVEMKLN